MNRISVDTDVRFGKPCVRGTRITVGEVLGTLASRRTETELREEFPQLVHEDILACFAFAAERERRLQVFPAALWPPPKVIWRNVGNVAPPKAHPRLLGDRAVRSPDSRPTAIEFPIPEREKGAYVRNVLQIQHQ